MLPNVSSTICCCSPRLVKQCYCTAGPSNVKQSIADLPKPPSSDGETKRKSIPNTPSKTKPKAKAAQAVFENEPQDQDDAAVSSAAEENHDEGEEEIDADEELEDEEEGGVASQKLD